MKLPDAIIAASASVLDAVLLTNGSALLKLPGIRAMALKFDEGHRTIVYEKTYHLYSPVGSKLKRFLHLSVVAYPRRLRDSTGSMSREAEKTGRGDGTSMLPKYDS